MNVAITVNYYYFNEMILYLVFNLGFHGTVQHWDSEVHLCA